MLKLDKSLSHLSGFLIQRIYSRIPEGEYIFGLHKPETTDLCDLRQDLHLFLRPSVAVTDKNATNNIVRYHLKI